jgi:hypothetical protein
VIVVTYLSIPEVRTKIVALLPKLESDYFTHFSISNNLVFGRLKGFPTINKRLSVYRRLCHYDTRGDKSNLAGIMFPLLAIPLRLEAATAPHFPKTTINRGALSYRAGHRGISKLTSLPTTHLVTVE